MFMQRPCIRLLADYRKNMLNIMTRYNVKVHVILAIYFLLATVITIVFFYPGYASNDTLNQLHQAQTGVFSDWHPVTMAIVWRIGIFITGNLASLLVLQCVLFYAGFYFISLALLRTYGRIVPVIAVCAIAIAPYAFGVVGMVWKDVLLTATLLFATGIILVANRKHTDNELSRRNRYILIGIIAFLLLFACTLRSNAVAFVVPLVVWAGVVFFNKLSVKKTVLVVICFVALSSAINSIIPRMVQAERAHIEISMMALDITNSVPPGEIVQSGLPNLLKNDLVRLSQCSKYSGTIQLAFWVCIPEGFSTDSSFYVYRQDLAGYWRQTITNNPLSYSKFKLKAYSLFLFSGKEQLISIKDSQLVSPPNSERFERINSEYVYGFSYTYASFLYKPWFWVVIDLVLIAWATADRNKVKKVTLWMVFALATSALLNIFSFFPASVTPDYRYIYWSALASSVAVLFFATDRLIKQPGRQTAE